MWLPLGVVYGILTVACGAGFWLANGGRRAVRWVGVCVTVIGVLGLVAWPLAPMHQREVLAAGGADYRDTLHLVLAFADTALFMTAMAVGAFALGGRFRVFSIAMI